LLLGLEQVLMLPPIKSQTRVAGFHIQLAIAVAFVYHWAMGKLK
jgi:hypothetical protein